MRTLIALALLVVGLLNASALSAQSGSFSGTVLIDPSEKPVAGAEIFVRDLNRSVRTDSAGNFLLRDLPYGRHVVIIRMVGYEQVQTDVVLSDTKPLIEADLFLKAASTKLSEVEVKAAPSPYAMRLVDFEERRSTGIGRFMTADVFERNAGRPLSSLITQNIPGVKAVSVNGKRWLASQRGLSSISYGASCSNTPGSRLPPCATLDKIPAACYMQVVVNGVIRYNGLPGQQMFDIDEINSENVIGFEFYTTATTPLQYRISTGNGLGACGTVIIWTKGG